MKILVISNCSQNIAELNALTAPNKQAYCDRHGYTFENVEQEYHEHERFLRIIRERLTQYDVVMHMGCDTIFTNLSVRVEDRIEYSNFNKSWEGKGMNRRVVVAREHLNWWPINNDVCIFPKGHESNLVLDALIDSSEVWLKYPWLWQNQLWNLMQEPKSQIKNCVRIVEAREMNSTFQPSIGIQNGDRIEHKRIPGPSSWQLGDWILHALDMPLQQRIEIIKWGLQFVGDGSWKPKSLDAQPQVN